MGFSLRGKKLGMSHFFLEDGTFVPCTLLEVLPHVVVQIKEPDRDGYSALQLGVASLGGLGSARLEKRVSKPLLGHFKKAGVVPHKDLFEVRVEDVNQFSVGQEIGLEIFEGVESVDVMAISKGKGYQGVMKRCGFKGHGASHGTGPIHRHAGSRGQRSTPGRIFPMNPAAGRMGGALVSVQNLSIVWRSKEEGLLAVMGAVPGARGGSWVCVRHAIKKHGGSRISWKSGGVKCLKS
ncbi:50S ribosomal protein L3 [Candidatus Similichlamydia laticola]|uniref:Large ribosomal subunit protein uL3 n=1 Tax=Candidatus Similichlamydia laticola TaxID=2170265 RepID=A0A369KEQ0_9BACT|nr:50S ribosomal protein L3 [Candidatus Similichlamydia laticola]RDB31377.1 LSU ribosomal protein L3p (L3e) [Candidatus Similichlamydia laticola]